MAGGMKAVIWADTINGVLLAGIFDFLKLWVVIIWALLLEIIKKSYDFYQYLAQKDVFYNFIKKHLTTTLAGGLWEDPSP